MYDDLTDEGLPLDMLVNAVLELSEDRKNTRMTVNVKLFGNKVFEKSPFKLTLDTVGEFEIIEGTKPEEMAPNMMAIIYPYIRSSITMITSTAGVSP